MDPCEEYICSTAQKPPIYQQFNYGGSGLGAPSIPIKDLPLNSIRLGQATWPLLHKMALRYPKNPTEQDKNKMRRFLSGFSWIYPCRNCAEDLRKQIQKSQPKLQSREEFSIWLCQQHNFVNQKLRKPKYLCQYSQLQMQYR